MESNRLNLARLLSIARLRSAARLLALGGIAVALTACGGGGGGGGGDSNSAPTAVISATPTSGKAPLTVALSGAGSTDRDGSIASYRWTYSDGAAADTSATTTRIFTTGGTFTVTLTVTDNRGATGTASTTISVSANAMPTASFTATPTSGKAPLAVAFDGSASADADGTIATYAWVFGDGGTATGATASHTYAAPGTYIARLTVTDNNGGIGTSTTTVTVRANALPTASFTAAPSTGRAPLAVAFDAGASADTDGTISSYQWDFGDGQVGAGATVSHTYTVGGAFTARLTVTDNEGATGTTTRTITTLPPVGSLAVTVKDTNGVGVGGAAVVATVGTGGKSGTTNASGFVLLADVPTGSGTVAVSRDSFVSKTVPVTVTANTETPLNLELVRVTTATGGVLTTSTPPAVVSDAGKTLSFSIQVVVVNESSEVITGLLAPAFTLRNCSPDAATTDADCVKGATGFDAAYTVAGPGADPSFQELPGGAPQPYAATLMFDQSFSIAANDPTDARLYSAKEFLTSLAGSDVAAVAAFADGETAGARIPVRPVTIYPVGAPSFYSSSNYTALFPDLDSLAALEGGGTPLYEAMCRSMDFTVASAPAGVRRAVVLFTDGRNDPSGITSGYICTTQAQTIAKSAATGVDMFTIGLAGDVDGVVLATLAEAGNGTFLFADDVTQLIPIYGSLGNLLSGSLSTYKLTFRISATADGTFAAGRSVLGTLSVNAGSNVVNLPFVVRIF